MTTLSKALSGQAKISLIKVFIPMNMVDTNTWNGHMATYSMP